MQLKGNSLLKVLVPIVLVIALIVLLKACGNDQSESADDGSDRQDQSDEQDPSLTLTDEEIKALGIEGDTPRDTVATLVGELRQMRKELDQTRAESAKLREQNQRLAQRAENVDSTVSAALHKERQRDAEERQSLMQSLEKRLGALKHFDPGKDAQEDLPVGLGLDGGGVDGEQRLTLSNRPVWIEPLDVKTTDDGETIFPSSFSGFGNAAQAAQEGAKTLGRGVEAVESRVTGKPAASTVEPVYTVPKNATLTGSVAMTALLGRVPIDDSVQDPYPFKVIIGKDNLTANGVEIPEVQGAIVSGTTTGDWTLSCARGTVKSITFVFSDGTVRTVPESADPSEGNSQESNEIGWISNPQGLPCIPGERKTNARQYLTTSFLLAAAEGAADATSLEETTQSVDSEGVVSAVTGDSGKFVAGRAASEGLSDVREWVEERYGQTFDAIYVPPGRAVAVHVNKTLAIDYETEGRKVHYAQSDRTQRHLD